MSGCHVSTAYLQRLQPCLNRHSLRLQERRQGQRLAQRRQRLIGREARPVGRQLEQDAVADAEVERLEVEAVDHARRAQPGAGQVVQPRPLLRAVAQPEGDVVDAEFEEVKK